MGTKAQQDAVAMVNQAVVQEQNDPRSHAAAQVVTKLAVSATATAVSTAGGVAVAASAGGATIMASAAAGAAAVPVVGWIVAAGLLVAAATISIVRAVRGRKRKRREIIEQARAMGIEGPEEAPGTIVKALQKGPAWRMKEMTRLAKRSNKGKSRGKDASKLRILAAVDLTERATANGYEEPAIPAAILAQEYPPPPGVPWLAVAGVSATALVLIAAATRVRRSRRES